MKLITLAARRRGGEDGHEEEIGVLAAAERVAKEADDGLEGRRHMHERDAQEDGTEPHQIRVSRERQLLRRRKSGLEQLVGPGGFLLAAPGDSGARPILWIPA